MSSILTDQNSTRDILRLGTIHPSYVKMPPSKETVKSKRRISSWENNRILRFMLRYRDERQRRTQTNELEQAFGLRLNLPIPIRRTIEEGPRGPKHQHLSGHKDVSESAGQTPIYEPHLSPNFLNSVQMSSIAHLSSLPPPTTASSTPHLFPELTNTPHIHLFHQPDFATGLASPVLPRLASFSSPVGATVLSVTAARESIATFYTTRAQHPVVASHSSRSVTLHPPNKSEWY